MKMILSKMKIVLLGIVAFLGIALISYSGVSEGTEVSMKYFIAGLLLLIISMLVFLFYEGYKYFEFEAEEKMGGDGDD
jgi:drug/metabolite transporter (DMT)-like permease